MLQSIKAKFRSNPTTYYALSIAASWAGAGSLMNSTTLAKTLGVIPALIWCIFNTLACIVFGLIIHKLPTVREVMRTKVCRIILALFSIFQIWLCMTAINEAWAGTFIGQTGAMIMTFGFTILFIVALFKKGIIANILTDNGGMYIIYALVLALSLVSFGTVGFSLGDMSLGLEKSNLLQGLYKGFLLLPGPFTYPYFFKLLDYNDDNGEAVRKCDITKAFIFGGIGFGAYLVFAFSLIFTSVSPALEICKAVLLSALAISSLSSFIYSEFAVFGKNVGLTINLFSLAFWLFVAPLGVMGVWTLMAETRVYLIAAILVSAVVKRLLDRKEAAAR